MGGWGFVLKKLVGGWGFVLKIGGRWTVGFRNRCEVGGWSKRYGWDFLRSKILIITNYINIITTQPTAAVTSDYGCPKL